MWMVVGLGNQVPWRSTFFEAFFFILCYWQNFYPFGALTYPFWKDLETLINEFKHKGTSPIRLAHPLIRIEQQATNIILIHHSFTLKHIQCRAQGLTLQIPTDPNLFLYFFYALK